jgi:two-component system OmpR family response regulator
MSKALIIDDEQQMRRLLRMVLESRGYEVCEAADGQLGLQEAAFQRPDVVLLDLGLPGLGGIDVLKRLREWTDVPVLILSVRDQETVKVEALELGADDYLAKPFNPRELLARIRAVLRRASGEGAAAKEPPAKTIRFSGWTLEPSRRRLLNPDGAEVPLTGGEYELLLVLLDRPNRVLTRDMLMDLLRGRQAGPYDRAIDVAVSRLRRRLEDDGRNPALIKTVRGGGYVLATTVERG